MYKNVLVGINGLIKAILKVLKRNTAQQKLFSIVCTWLTHLHHQLHPIVMENQYQ